MSGGFLLGTSSLRTVISLPGRVTIWPGKASAFIVGTTSPVATAHIGALG